RFTTRTSPTSRRYTRASRSPRPRCGCPTRTCARGYGDRMTDTRQRLVDGAIETLRTHGLAGASARTIAATAGVNQALVFYHFGSVHELLEAACVAATEAR